MNNYHVWCETLDQDEDDAVLVMTYEAEMAAKIWAEQYERRNAEYPIASGHYAADVSVREKSGELRRFSVSGECVPRYIATRLP